MPTKARVLFLLPSLEQGGAERQLAELIRQLDRSRYEPYLALSSPVDDLGYDLGVGEPFLIPPRSGPSPRSLVHLVALLRRLRPDVLHSFMGHQNIYGRLAVRISGVGRAVGSVLCTRLPRQYIRHERWTHRFTDGLIVNSIGIREELVRRAGLSASSIDVVENGVDSERFRPMDEPERRRARDQWGLAGRFILLPARITAQKNQLNLVAALALLEQKGELPADVTVGFAGREHPSSFYGTAVRTLVNTARLGKRVRFFGIVKEVESLLAASDAMILPSGYEGLPNAVLEALACGTPAIVSPRANTDHLVDDGKEGIVLESASPFAIAHGLKRFFAKTEPEARAMGVEGRARAVSRFSVARMVDRTCAVYDRVLAQRG